MTGEVTDTARDLVRHARFPMTTAARAPSVHNTRPWRFQVSPGAVELWCDPGRTGVLPHAISTSAGGIGQLRAGQASPPITAVLLAARDGRAAAAAATARCQSRGVGRPVTHFTDRLVLVQADGLHKLSPSSDRCLTIWSSSSRPGIPGLSDAG